LLVEVVIEVGWGVCTCYLLFYIRFIKNAVGDFWRGNF